MANYRNYNGPNAAGSPKNKIPDWLDHTANALSVYSINGTNVSNNTAAERDAGPNQPAWEFITKGS